MKDGEPSGAGTPAVDLVVPADAGLRREMEQAAQDLAATRRGRRAPGRQELRRLAGELLAERCWEETHLGFLAVMVNNACCLHAFRRVPYARRLLLLPRCLEGIGPAWQGELATPLGRLVARARELGYTIKVADGTPLAVRLLSTEKMDALLGISCLDSLDQAFSKVRLLGVPALAVPLLGDGCKATTTDLSLVARYLDTRDTVFADTAPGYLPLLRRIRGFFAPDRVGEFIGCQEGPAADAGRWIARGGKRLRPFVSAAVHQAASGVKETPRAVELAAFAVEVFHKASLVHDDIEDHDRERYGEPSLHEELGMEQALNVGDYLIGLGYRLLGQAGAVAASGRGAELLELFSQAHLDLARGQGLELALRQQPATRPSLEEVTRIYSLKTSPAFAAALGAGLVLAGKGREEGPAVDRYCRYLGVGFQVLNDLQGWRQDGEAERLSVLPLLARMAGVRLPVRPATADLERIYEETGTFTRARELVEKCRHRALEAAGQVTGGELQDLLEALLELILERRE